MLAKALNFQSPPMTRDVECLGKTISHHVILRASLMLLNLKSVVVVLSLATMMSPAVAETINRNMLGCVTEDLLDEVIGYANKSDKDGMMQLVLSGKCVMLRAGEAVSVISPGFSVATIRYKGTKIFTPSEALR